MFDKVKLSEVSVDDVLVADGGFTCLKQGEYLTVYENQNGELYVECSHGPHLLDGQVDWDDGDTLIGFTRP